MNREKVLKFVEEKYGTIAEYPWKSSPYNAVLRHNENNKWYGIIIKVSKDKLKIGNKDEFVDIINLKVDPVFGDILRQNKGIYRAYHMNKEKWISVLIDGTVNENIIKDLICDSFNLTL